jgi:hypothetical protein
MSELFNLPPTERAKRYREFAAEAFRLAEAAPERVARQSYMTIAEQWKKRADAIERNILKYGTLFTGSGHSLSSEPPREAATLS